MKKYFIQVFALLLCAAVLIPAGISEAKSKAKKIDEELLKDFGFTQEELDKMEEAEREYWSSFDGKVLGVEETYFHISYDKNGKPKIEKTNKEKAEKGAKDRKEKDKELRKKKSEELKNKKGQIYAKVDNWTNEEVTDDWIELRGYVGAKNNGNYQFKVNYYWLTIPKIQIDDVVGISHSQNWSIIDWYEFAKNSVNLRYTGYEDTYAGCASCKDRVIDSTDVFDYDLKVGVNGVASEFRLNNGLVTNRYQYSDEPKGYITMNAEPSVTNMTKSNIYGSYGHQEISASTSFDIFPANISFSPSFAFSEADNVNVQFPVK